MVSAFLATHPEFVSLSAAEVLLKQGIEMAGDAGDGEAGERLRLLPHRQGTDGFFAAVMERR